MNDLGGDAKGGGRSSRAADETVLGNKADMTGNVSILGRSAKLDLFT